MMQSRNISFCAPLGDDFTTARAVCGRVSRLNCDNTHVRTRSAKQNRGPILLFRRFTLLICCLTLAFHGRIGGAATTAASVITSPAAGSVLPGSTATFTWTAASGVSQYQLWVGSSAGKDNLGLCAGMATTCQLTGLPTNGETLYVQLDWDISGKWTSTDYTYSAASSSSPTLSGLSCATASMTAAGTDSCTVTLNSAALSGGLAVSLASNNSAVTVPASVTVAAGATTASFTATVSSVSTAETVTLTASANSAAKTFALQLGTAAPVLSGLTCVSGSMTGAGTDSCTVTLNSAAQSGGFAVSVASNESAVTVPASLTVPAGATTASFTATVSSVSTAETVTLTASANSAAKTFALQLGTGTPTLSIDATSIAFGSVNLNTAATQSVILSSTGTTAVTVSAATVVGSGFTVSGVSFPLTLSPNQTATLSIQFDPGSAVTDTGTLTVVSTSHTNPTDVISLSGTGVTVSYETDLSWNAPASSAVPVAGYNVYRSPSGASSYAQLNTSVVIQTTYVDTTVKSAQTYDYIVESVSASGTTSSPSNMTAVPIP